MARFLILFSFMRTQSAASKSHDNGSLKEDYLSLYYKEISKAKPLSPDEEASLARRIRQDDRQALNQLIRANLRFVVSVCRNYQNQG
jgi:DNA-directed RNA polymerase sigma subunit (sigma70/sigma32)